MESSTERWVLAIALAVIMTSISIVMGLEHKEIITKLDQLNAKIEFIDASIERVWEQNNLLLDVEVKKYEEAGK